MYKSKFSVSEAHRITGKSRTTIQAHLKSGKLSAERDNMGQVAIDAAELVRVYGDVCKFDNAASKSSVAAQSKRTETEQVSNAVQAEIALAEQEIQHLKDKISLLEKREQVRIEHNDRLNGLLDEANRQISSTQHLLTDERQRRADLEQSIAERKSGFFSRLFGA